MFVYIQGTGLQLGGSSHASSSLTERLLRQNAELTGFVSRLTEEKNDLRNQILRLEEELRRYRQAGLGSGDSVSVSRIRFSCTVALRSTESGVLCSIMYNLGI